MWKTTAENRGTEPKEGGATLIQSHLPVQSRRLSQTNSMNAKPHGTKNDRMQGTQQSGAKQFNTFYLSVGRFVSGLLGEDTKR